MSEFFEMGGYAAFVWPAFGVTALVMVGIWAQSALSLKSRQAELDALQKLNGEAS